MTLNDLLKNRRLQAHKPTPDEIANLLDMAKRSLADAEVKGLSVDWSYMIAYGGVLSLAAAVLHAEGYRPRGEGHHATLFDALSIVMPDKAKLASYFHDCRKKRNTMTYTAPSRASEAEAKELLAQAKTFYSDVEKWLASKHANLVLAPPKP